MDVHNSPILSEIFDDFSLFAPVPNSMYVGMRGIEERSRHFTGWDDVAICEITHEDVFDFGISLPLSGVKTFQLRNRSMLAQLWNATDAETIYLDITGLRHHVWMPLLRSAIATTKPVLVVYVEPDSYSAIATPTEGQIYDLSEKILGIAPIPGFASLPRDENDFVFIPLLGFEGTRVAYLLEMVQPVSDRIVPVVGLPGFRPEHPYSTYLGNRTVLQESEAWRKVRFAAANCPFSLYYLLEDVAADYPGSHLKIATIGTKPQAVGAVLFTLDDMKSRELVYDHPVRKSQRTSGLGRLLVYDVGAFARP